MKILIAGSDINAKLLASYLKIEDSSNDIYITTDEHVDDNVYTPIGIKENDITSICDFVKYNQIEFTIATSPIAVINGIADEFKKEGFPVFAPVSESARITFFNSIAKKIMYKLKINTPRFGIFDRENLAIDYVRNTKLPIVIENDFTLFSYSNLICKNFSQAKLELQKVFEEGNNKIVIQNYIDEEPCCLYFVTDGYNALPIISLNRTEKDKYTQVIAPSPLVSEDIIRGILQRVIYPLLDDISKYADMYVGILGLKFQIHNRKIFVNEFYNGFQNYDIQALIPLLNDNLLNILFDSANSALTDNRDFIDLKEDYSYTIAIDKKEIESFTEDDDDFIITEEKDKYIFTSTAPTLNKAKEKMYEYLKIIAKGEIFDQIIKDNLQKELRV